MRVGKQRSRLAVIFVLLMAVTGLTTACGGYGAAVGAVVGAGIGAAVGGSVGCYDYYDYGCGGYYSTSEPEYDDTW